MTGNEMINSQVNACIESKCTRNYTQLGDPLGRKIYSVVFNKDHFRPLKEKECKENRAFPWHTILHKVGAKTMEIVLVQVYERSDALGTVGNPKSSAA